MIIGLDARGIQEGYKAHKHRGIGRVAEKLLTLLPQLDRKIQFRYLFDLDYPIDFEEKGENVEFVVIPKCPPLYLKKEFIKTHYRLPSFLRKQKQDLMHFISHEDAPVWTREKNILTVHDTIPLALPDLYKVKTNPLQMFKHFVLKQVVKKADAIITNSECSKSDIHRFHKFPLEKIHVSYFAADERFKEAGENEKEQIRHKYNNGKPFILYLGGVDPRKNLKRIIMALESLEETKAIKPDFLIAGDLTGEKTYPQFKKILDKSSIKTRVRIIGYVPDQELPALLSAADLFVFPTLYEGFGLPVLESMACGTPVLSSNNSSIPEVGGEAYKSVNPESVSEIAEGIFQILNSNDYAEELRQKGFQQARRFSWEKAAEKTLSIYHKVLNC